MTTSTKPASQPFSTATSDAHNLAMWASRDMGIYLHIPFCRKKCSYCDFASYEGLEAYYDDYVDALIREMTLWAEAYPDSTTAPVRSVYFGGGTPTQLSEAHWEKLFGALRSLYHIDDAAEITTEANPGEITRPYLQYLRQLGINRISFGIQTFDEPSLAILRRGHTAEEAVQAVTDAAAVGFPHISGDLIYALPGQTIDQLKANIQRLEALPVDHISIYGLQLEEGTNLEKQVRTGVISLPDEDEAELMYDTMLEQLALRGFERYEISNFARNGAYSRHNTRYWHYGDYLGFGCGAHSLYHSVRRGNEPLVVPYIQAIREGRLPHVERRIVTPQEAREDFCFLALRTKWGLQSKLYEERFGETVVEHYGTIIDRLVHDGLLRTSEWGTDDEPAWMLTGKGAKYGNHVFEEFIE